MTRCVTPSENKSSSLRIPIQSPELCQMCFRMVEKRGHDVYIKVAEVAFASGSSRTQVLVVSNTNAFNSGILLSNHSFLLRILSDVQSSSSSVAADCNARRVTVAL